MSKGGAKWGIIGAIAGAIGGLLFAPKSGKETREDIKAGAGKAKVEAEQKLKETKADVEKRVASGKKTARTYAGKAKRAAAKAKQDIEDEFKSQS